MGKKIGNGVGQYSSGHGRGQKTVQVFSKLDTPVRDWVLGQGVPGTISDSGTSVQTVPVEVHQSIRPITPTMRSPVAGKGWSPISMPDRASVTGTPKSTPGQRLRIGGSPAVPLRGIPINIRGIPMEQSLLLETYMQCVSPAYLPEEIREQSKEEREHEEESTVPTLPVVQEGKDSEDEDTSAKESTGGSPRVPKIRKRRRSSERMTVTSETIESEGTPVFKARRKAIVKGKDIGNRAAKSQKKSKTSTVSSMEEPGETIEETLDEVFTAPAVTHKTSLYKQFRKEQAALRRDARDPNYGGKGWGKGGASRRKSATVVKKKPGTVPLEGWQDPEVVRALQGAPPSGTIRREAKSDTDAMVPHSLEEGSQSESSTQQVPQAFNCQAAESAKYAAAQARRVREELKKPA